jgi:hypothetical protein
MYAVFRCVFANFDLTDLALREWLIGNLISARSFTGKVTEKAGPCFPARVEAGDGR